MHKNAKKKIHFTLLFMIHLTVQSWVHLVGATKDELSDLHKDSQDGAFEVALKDALELHLWLHFLMQALVHKFVQNGSSNRGPDAVLEGAVNGRLNVALDGTP